jgi:hypothetical protein
MNDREERRVGRNQALFRQTNEAIEQGLWPGEERGAIRFRCECARLDCQSVVVMSLEAYEAVRASGRQFVVVSGHEEPEVERVLERGDGYVVVEKFGEAGSQVERSDPRDPAGDQE